MISWLAFDSRLTKLRFAGIVKILNFLGILKQNEYDGSKNSPCITDMIALRQETMRFGFAPKILKKLVPRRGIEPRPRR